VIQSGGTLARAGELLTERGAAAVLAAILAVKPHANPAAKADFRGFDAGPDFLFGYGMDHDGLQRGLPDIRIVKN
jgi:hypoxanthine-guanine phosphoribosyltransferase